jgi:predicted nucleotidyltransferase
MSALSIDPILDAICALVQADPRIDVLWLYGSRARGTAQSDSDYDLAVAFNTFPKDQWDRRLQPEQLCFEWSDALGLQSGRLSVVDINNIPLPLAYAVISTGRVLHVRNGLLLAREENRINSMWEIDHAHHLRHDHPRSGSWPLESA